MILDNVKPITSGSTTQPIFTYFGFNTADAPQGDKVLTAPLTTSDRDLVVRVGAAFDAMPARNSGGKAARSDLDTRFENSVFVRTADPLQPGRDPASCV